MVWGWVSVDSLTPIDSRWGLNAKLLCDNLDNIDARIHDDADPTRP